MTILLVGLNHRTAPVELREKLALDACAPEAVYRDLARPGLKERLILSTCNRVEVLAVVESLESALTDIQVFFGRRPGLTSREFEDHFYVLTEDQAVKHLFRVASSLDSMVVGEPQILGQLKEAYRLSLSHQATGPILNKLMHKSFSVAKRVRSETGIASHAVSIGYAAVELARKIFGELQGKKVLLIGAGEMAELTAEHLLTHGASEIVVANRTLKRAINLAHRWGGQAASLEELPALLAQVDIVISSTGSPEIVVTSNQVRSILKTRRHRPLFFVDIAVPRDIDPQVNQLDNVYLYDIDDLAGVVEENREARATEAVRAGRIIEEEAIAFLTWIETLDTFPTIIALTQKAEGIRQAELKKTLNKIGQLTPGQTQAIETLTRALTQKLIHDPILFIKSASRRGKKEINLNYARRVLGLDQDQEDGQRPDQEDQDGEQDLPTARPVGRIKRAHKGGPYDNSMSS